MKTIFLFLWVIGISVANGQRVTQDKISFINFTPVVDGMLDDKLINLEEKKFNHFFQFDNPKADSIPVTYRIGYTPSHLYLYIETKADSITYRDRGFINGDGFKLLLAKPQQDSLTDEYYDIVFSPSKDKKYWARKRIWDYNRNQDHGKKLSAATLFEEKGTNGKCGFEVMLAWKDVEPYHPWFSEQLGYNLYFAKAISNNAANGYSVVKDEGIWDEEIPKRNFHIIRFEKPTTVSHDFITAKLNRRNIKTGDPLVVNLVAASNKAVSKTIEFSIQNDTAKTFLTRKKQYRFKDALQNELVKLNPGNLVPGHYNLSAYSGSDSIARYDFVIFPKFDFNGIRSKILANLHHLESGTVNTLMFRINSIEQDLSKLKEYETGKELLNEYLEFEKEYQQFLKGNDPFLKITKPYRRAFKSKYDNTYQPYTIKLPRDYDPAKKYPLLVFLHGSGQDEQHVLDKARSGGNFIELAPFGRDMYNCYSSDSSQNDISEAIEDVMLHFSADSNKIIIGGFSMGGYGALRTFYQHPGLYKAVAVFAGHPNLANDWLGSGHPDFVEEKNLDRFSKIPVFIYHGRKDGALPIAEIEKLATKLRAKNIPVTERLINDKAHEYPDEETNRIYFEWLTEIAGK